MKRIKTFLYAKSEFEAVLRRLDSMAGDDAVVLWSLRKPEELFEELRRREFRFEVVQERPHWRIRVRRT